jgi:DNA-directed RNA polymerase beta subunit
MSTQFRDPSDYAAVRQRIFNKTLQSLQDSALWSNDQYTLTLENLKYQGPEKFSRKDEKKALLEDGSLTRKLRGNWILRDKAGKVVQKSNLRTVMNVPYLTSRGTFLRDGTEYTIANQFRLVPNMYFRQTDDGMPEVHVNPKPGSGTAFRMFMDPDKGVFYMKHRGNKVPLYPVLRAMGKTDEEIGKAWGPNILERNQRMGKSPHAINWINRIAKDPRYNPDIDPDPTEAVEEVDVPDLDINSDLFDPEDEPVFLKSAAEYDPRFWIGVDLDGTLATYNGWDGPTSIGAPVPKMVRRVKRWLKNGKTIKIFTARMAGDSNNAARKAITRWCEKHVGQALPITNVKDQFCIGIWDDKAKGVIRNTGVQKGMKPKFPAVDGTPAQPESAEQAEAGNYQKGHMRLQGLDLTIETKRNQYRKGIDQDGNEWSVKMNHHYGYIKRTMSDADGDHIDVFVGPYPDSELVVIVNQVDPKTGRFDEHKCMLGFQNEKQAREAYLSNYDKGWKGLDSTATMSMEQFKQWTVEGDTSKRCKTPDAGDVDTRSSQRLQKLLARRDPDGIEKTAGALAKLDNDATRTALVNHFSSIELDPDATTRTMGQPIQFLEPRNMLDATGRLLAINRGEDSGDSRDSLQFQKIYDTADYLSEKISRDRNSIMRQQLWKATRTGNIDKIPPGVLDKHMDELINNDRLSQALEMMNPLEPYDHAYRVTRLGQGGISSIDAVPEDARGVQPSQMGFVDPVRSPESMKVGIDLRMAAGVKIGEDGLLYRDYIDAGTGRKRPVSMKEAAGAVVAFPQHINSDDQFIPAMVRGKGIQYVDRKEVDLIMEDPDQMFSTGANLVPLKASTKAMRLLMGGKHGVSAVPLVEREAPLVQNRDPNDHKSSVERNLGKALGAVRADQPGVVKAVYPDHIDVETADGEKVSYELYNRMPNARKTFTHNTPVVKAGDVIKPGQTLAKSTFTDDEGTAALGKNLSVAYMNYDGITVEDAVVVSESAARKLTSEHLFNKTVPKEKGVRFGKKDYVSQFPSRYSKDQLGTLDDNGVVKPGTVVKEGDPMVLAFKETESGSQTLGRRLRSDRSSEWHHDFDAIVTDVAKTKKGYVVYTRANLPMRAGDKLSARFGNKGVISEVIPDEQMPRDKAGNPIDVIMSPTGIISRTNTSQLLEAALGKVAAKTGKPYVLPGFFEGDDEEDPDRWLDYAQKELKKAGLKDTETLFNPKSGKDIKDIFTGVAYIYKHPHMGEGKAKGRSTGAYTQDQAPMKGGPTGAKHLGGLQIDAILGHSARNVLKDAKLVTGQQNDDYWRRVKLNQTPSSPGTPYSYEKFENLIKAAGVNLKTDKTGDHLFAMTNKQAQEMTGSREITNPGTYTDKELRPIKGGLFDPEFTGSELGGDRWAHIRLPEPVLNPVMEDPIRILLGTTQKELNALVSGEVEVGGKRGGHALKHVLERINLDTAMENAVRDAEGSAKGKRDMAIRRLGYLQAMKKQGVHPSEFMMDRVPVLPPRFRPITRADDMVMVADPNFHYRELLHATQDYKDAQESDLPPSLQNEARENLYKTYKALVGTADPTKAQLQEKNVGGILQTLLGKGSPKNSFVHRRVIGTNMDMGGLGVLTPDPDLTIDQVGLPESQAWETYRPYVIRELVRQGVTALDAAKMSKEHHPKAYKALQTVVKDRPLLVNRAPSLHKYSVMALEPVLTKGHTIKLNPSLFKIYGADVDGDTMTYTLPISKEAVEEARERMRPSKNLLSVRNDKPHMGLINEYIQGAHIASRLKKGGTARTFSSMAEARKAFKAGEIDIDDPIRIA